MTQYHSSENASRCYGLRSVEEVTTVTQFAVSRRRNRKSRAASERASVHGRTVPRVTYVANTAERRQPQRRIQATLGRGRKRRRHWQCRQLVSSWSTGAALVGKENRRLTDGWQFLLLRFGRKEDVSDLLFVAMCMATATRHCKECVCTRMFAIVSDVSSSLS
jgi:hypothetical protein